MGSSTDLAAAGTRRLLVNAAYWCVDLEVPADGTKVDIVGKYEPIAYGFGTSQKGVRPSDHALEK